MQPEKTFKVGDARAAIFYNKNNGRNGAVWYSYSIHLHRRFEKEEGVWESTSSFKFYQLPQVALALKLATEYVAGREADVTQAPSVDASATPVNGESAEAAAPADSQF